MAVTLEEAVLEKEKHPVLVQPCLTYKTVARTAVDLLGSAERKPALFERHPVGDTSVNNELPVFGGIWR